jgi:membrane protease YdiL (CAAX protease family)
LPKMSREKGHANGVEDIVVQEGRGASKFATVRSFIRSHEVLTFFLLTYAIAWGALALIIPFISASRIEVVAIPLLLSAPFAPALSGIIVTTINDDRPRRGSLRAQATAFLAAWIPTTLIFLLNPNLKAMYDISPTIVVIGAATAMIPSFIISSAYSTNQGVREYLSSLVKPRGGRLWYLGAVLIYPALYLLGAVITNAFGQSVGWIRADMAGSNLGALAAITFLYQLFYGNCVGEEPGWRGFALRKLQSRYSPLVASLIVSSMWIPWHLPMWYLENGALTTAYLVRQFVYGGAIGVTFSWLYNRSEGSILAVGLMHASLNTSVILLPQTEAQEALMIVLAVLVAILDRMWMGFPDDRREEERPPLAKEPVSRLHVEQGCL